MIPLKQRRASVRDLKRRVDILTEKGIPSVEDVKSLNKRIINLPSKEDVKSMISGLVTQKDFEVYKRDWTWNRVLGQLLDKKSKKGVAFRILVAKRLIKESIKGNMYATKLIMERMDGMPQVDITTGGKAILGNQLTQKEIDTEIEKLEQKIASRLRTDSPQEVEEGEVVSMEPIVQK